MSEQQQPVTKAPRVNVSKRERVGNLLRGDPDPVKKAGGPEKTRGVGAGAADPAGRGGTAAAPESPGTRQSALELEAETGEKAKKAAEGEKAAEKGRADAPGRDAEGQDKGRGQEKTGKAAVPKTVKELAERLGVDPADCYQIALELAGDKGQVTLGQIKDYLQEYGTAPIEINGELVRRRTAADEAEEARERTSAEQIAIRRELVGLIGAMGQVPREVAERVERLQRSRLEREMALTLEGAPEWKDPSRFESDRREMVDILRPYGFTKTEVLQIDDSRLMMFMRDQVARARRVRNLREGSAKNNGAGEGEASPAGKSNQEPSARRSSSASAAARTSAIVRQGKAGNKVDKINAISALIRKG